VVEGIELRQADIIRIGDLDGRRKRLAVARSIEIGELTGVGDDNAPAGGRELKFDIAFGGCLTQFTRAHVTILVDSLSIVLLANGI